MRYWYKLVLLLKKIILRNRSYSGLMDNIEGLTLDEVQAKLNGFNVVMYKKNKEVYIAKLTSFHTEYILSFTPEGLCKGIELEYWKDLNVKFGKEMVTR